MKYIDEYRNSDTAAFLIKEIRKNADILADSGKIINIMEVCGSHTMAISRFGIRELLPENISLISGPGCPVCVTDAGYIDASIELAQKGCNIGTFGDMINVPGSAKTLSKCRSEGCHIEVCYSPMTILENARANPDKEFIFLAIGFETTIAPIVCMLDSAIKEGFKNISILTAFKLVPPALNVLTSDPELRIDAFLCPAHVSAIIGADAYEPIARKCNIPCVIASFEPVEILLGVNSILKQIVSGKAFVENDYDRVVKKEGNLKAQTLFRTYLKECDASWRGIGVIPKSGLDLKEEFAAYDASKKFKIEVKPGKHDKGCRCGDVLKGKIKPPECILFSAKCNPLNPVGPCMVSSEGTCSAYYKYNRKN
ncbi:MAG TPA: hydrogenase formation protein HypD [Lentisphaeria bacterium]|nr:MAG: hydrogenase formation protein HypD [Lentisphaerae bacterium GWF2_38_69]HBM15874.1 hydrogenase formation protein HypD [Lentisphaeria bacterium]